MTDDNHDNSPSDIPPADYPPLDWDDLLASLPDLHSPPQNLKHEPLLYWNTDEPRDTLSCFDLVSSPGVSADHQQSSVDVASVLEPPPSTSVSRGAVNGSVANVRSNNTAETLDDKSLQLILTHNWNSFKKFVSSYTSSVTLQNEPLPKWSAQLILPSVALPLQEQPEYVKLWEGYLCSCTTEGETRLMSKLHGYRRSTETDFNECRLAQDWPSVMFIKRIVYAEHTNVGEYTGMLDRICFLPEIPDGFRSSSHENVTYAVVLLTSQVLLLYISTDLCGWLEGLLIPKDLVDFELPSSSELQPEPNTGRFRIARSYPLTNRSRSMNRFSF